MLDYLALHCLNAVIEEGSFERAARRLNVTPSAVSQRIRLLEERVGCALVVRGQPCKGTDTGHRLCQHVQHVRLLEHDLQRQLPLLGPAADEHISVPVAVNADSLATWFMPALVTFTRQSAVLVQVTVDDENHTLDWLRQGTVLAAVTATPDLAVGCNSLPLGTMRYTAAASPTFVEQHFAEGVNLERLRQVPSLRFNPKDQLQQRWVKQQFGQTLALPGHTLSSPQAFVSAALAGMGWSLHPHSLIEQALHSGDLVELVPDSPVDVPLYWQQARSASSLLKDLQQAVMHAARSNRQGLRPIAIG
jgi:LysR family transcriptional regulator, chromosome initiation inhibitor